MVLMDKLMGTLKLTAQLYELVSDLVDIADISASILESFVESESNVSSKDHLLKTIGHARQSQGLKAVARLESLGLISLVNDIVELEIPLESAALASSFLSGAAHQANLQQNMAQLVLTPPKSPSSLIGELKKVGPRISNIQDTKEVVHYLAHSSKNRFIVMTPFLDAEGARFLVDTFSRVPKAVEKILILRFVSQDRESWGYPDGYDGISSWLVEQSVQVYDFAVKRPGMSWLETFHAKLVVADQSAAYVGSSNMNKSSLENSMEIGVLLTQEKELKLLVDILESILAISTKMR
jgi:hypothetical protein